MSVEYRINFAGLYMGAAYRGIDLDRPQVLASKVN
jgi:hypothetical protein